MENGPGVTSQAPSHGWIFWTLLHGLLTGCQGPLKGFEHFKVSPAQRTTCDSYICPHSRIPVISVDSCPRDQKTNRPLTKRGGRLLSGPYAPPTLAATLHGLQKRPVHLLPPLAQGSQHGLGTVSDCHKSVPFLHLAVCRLSGAKHSTTHVFV